MSWFGGASNSNIDQLIKDTTDESIPNGEIDLVKSLEFTDLIRSKKVPAKDAMRGLKKRLSSTNNPNTILSTLELVDTSIKNGGNHFILEICSREFLDFFNSKLIQDDDVSYLVRNKALKLIQEWAIAFSGKSEYKYFDKVYKSLKKQGHEFPEITSDISQNFFDSNVPPEWEDSDACMICSTQFSMLNRKHHCRNCGGVYCGEHSSKFIELVDLGITEPVRVCDTCYDEIKHKRKSSKVKKKRDVMKARAAYDSDDDEDLKRALELSLKESQGYAEAPTQSIAPTPSNVIVDEEDDEELKAAIAASLKDLEESKQRTQQINQQQAPAPLAPNDEYSNLLPRSNSNYQAQNAPNSAPLPSSNYYPSYPQQQQIPEASLNYLSPQQETAIRQFNSKAVQYQNNPHGDLRELTDAYKAAIPLQPTLVTELNDSYTRYDKFMELNSKIDNVMRLYNKILDDRIEGQRFGYNQGIQSPELPQYSHQQQQYNQYVPSQQFAPALQQQQQQPQQFQHQSPVTASSVSYSSPVQSSLPQMQATLPQVPSYQNHSPVQSFVQPIAAEPPSTVHNTQTPQQTVPQPELSNATSFEYPPLSGPQETEEEEEYSAPSYPPQQQPEPVQQVPPANASQIQQHAPQANYEQQPISVQPEHTQPQVTNPYNKVTDFNFPSVPIRRLDHQQSISQHQQTIQVEAPKDELLIEL